MADINSRPTLGFLKLFDPRTVRFKLLFTIVLSFALFSTYISYNQSKQVFSETKKELFNSADAFAELSVTSFGNTYLNFYNSGFLTFVNQSQDLLKLNKDIHKVQIINSSGEVLYDSTLVKQGDLLPPNIDQKISDPKILEGVQTANKVYIQDQQNLITQILQPFKDPFGFQPFSIIYTIDYKRANEISQNTLLSIVSTALLSTLVVIFLTSFVLHFLVLSPISKVIFGARRVTAGDLNYQIPLQGNNEIADLAQAVNFMATVLRKDIEALKSLDKLKDEFIIIASHNLRTPLTAIKGYLEFLKNDLKNIDQKDRTFLDHANQATEKLYTLSEELIKIVNIKSGQNPFDIKKVSVGQLIEDSIQNFYSRIEEKQIKISKSIADVPNILADKHAIESVLNNILENAVKFSNPGGQIEIKSYPESLEVIFSVQDHGKGLSQDQLDNLFQKFHRGEELLTYDYEGEGLGLYLNQLIIKAHNGRIWAISKPGEGATFYFSLPAANS